MPIIFLVRSNTLYSLLKCTHLLRKSLHGSRQARARYRVVDFTSSDRADEVPESFVPSGWCTLYISNV